MKGHNHYMLIDMPPSALHFTSPKILYIRGSSPSWATILSILSMAGLQNSTDEWSITTVELKRTMSRGRSNRSPRVCSALTAVPCECVGRREQGKKGCEERRERWPDSTYVS
ncbi:hypothetical protein PAMP_016291 [Pampus punctatissimus]